MLVNYQPSFGNYQIINIKRCNLYNKDRIVMDPNQSQGQNKKKQKKQKPANQEEKKNTDAWKEKQALKKKQKEAKQTNEGQAEAAQKQPKQEKKQKKKKQKQAKQKQEQQKKQDKKDKKQSEQTNAIAVQNRYKQLQTVDTLIVPKHLDLLENREAQVELIQKQVLNLIRPGDTILYLGKMNFKGKDKKQVSSSSTNSGTNRLAPGSGAGQFKLVQIPGMTRQYKDSQIVCRYEDISHLISQQIDKIFMEAQTIFQNGSILLTKGYENILIACRYYNKPVVITTGSWNYSKQSVSSYNQLQAIFGEDLTNRYDWVSGNDLDLVCLEFGPVLPSHVGLQVEQGYKNYGIYDSHW